jgi:hypothetical protein
MEKCEECGSTEDVHRIPPGGDFVLLCGPRAEEFIERTLEADPAWVRNDDGSWSLLEDIVKH